MDKTERRGFLKLVGVVAVMLLMSGCATWNKTEKFWFGAMATTNLAGETFFNEEHSHHAKDIGVKVGTIAVFYALGELFPQHRTTIFQAGAGLGIASIGYGICGDDDEGRKHYTYDAEGNVIDPWVMNPL
jgi:hypothetical protein